MARSKALKALEDTQAYHGRTLVSQMNDFNTLAGKVEDLTRQVEELQRKESTAPAMPLPESTSLVTSVRAVLCAIRPDVIMETGYWGHIQTHHKIESIKELRHWMPIGPKEAKDLVESLPKLVTLDLRQGTKDEPRTIHDLRLNLDAAGLVYVLIPD